jgi:hypothetical protein
MPQDLQDIHVRMVNKNAICCCIYVDDRPRQSAFSRRRHSERCRSRSGLRLCGTGSVASRVHGDTLLSIGDGRISRLGRSNAGRPERESVPLGPERALFDFLPMNTILGHADLLVTNGGFNTVMRAHSEGVPLVVAGEGADKAEFAARVAFAGSGINLGTGGPTVPSVKEAVDTRLAGGSYRRKAEETKLS